MIGFNRSAGVNINRLIQVVSASAVLWGAVASPSAADWEWTATGPFAATGLITTDSGGLQAGPTTVHLGGTLDNNKNMAGADITSAVITGTVPTNLPNCHAFADSSASSTNPWRLTTTTADTVDITNVTFTNHYTTVSTGAPGCAAFGVPAAISVAGTFTGTVVGEVGATCINLNNHADDLIVEGGATNVNFTSAEDICIEGVDVE